MTKYFIPLAIVAAGLIIAGAVVFTNSGSQLTEKPEAEVEQEGVPAVEPKIEGEPYLGDPKAPVKLVYYGDFQCPFCKRIEENTFPEVIEKYVDTGKAVFYFKNFQFLGPDSTAAGVAGECIIKQLSGDFGPYWQWYNTMFEKQDAENAGFGSAQDIKSLVRELNLSGIDVSQFEGCLDNQETISEVQADTQEGQADGVTGIPATFVNGWLIGGAQPFSAFESAIEAELNK